MSKLRRHTMMQQATIPANPLIYTIRYYGAGRYDRTSELIICEHPIYKQVFEDYSIIWEDAFCSYKRVRTDIGVNDYIQTIVKEPAICEGEYIQPQGTVDVKWLPYDIYPFDVSKDIYFVGFHKPTSITYDFEFRYDGGGDSRKVRILTNNLTPKVFNIGSYSNYYDFQIIRVSAQTDYFRIVPNVDFIKDGVLYPAGTQLDYPWSMGTIINDVIKVQI